MNVRASTKCGTPNTVSGGLVCPELKGIKQNDAEQWATLKEVEHVCGRHNLIPDIREIYKRPELLQSEKRIPMDDLAKELEKIIKRHSGGET